MVIYQRVKLEEKDVEYIKLLCKQRKLSLAKLSKLLGFSKAYLSNILKGKKIISIDLYNKILGILEQIKWN